MTSDCLSVRDLLAAYLDGALPEEETSILEAHVVQCPGCRFALEENRQLISMIRDDEVLPRASGPFRKRIEETLKGAPARRAPEHLRRRIRSLIETNNAGMFRRHWIRISAAVLIVAFGLAAWLAHARSIERQEFARVAVDTHQRRLEGNLPLELTSNSPEEVSRWFVGKVPFQLTLPNFEVVDGEEKPYDLEGARLVGFRNDYAANVSYRMKGKLITLLVASDTVAQPSGDETVTFRNISFYFQSKDSLKVITWKDRGLSYALVSDLEARGQESCLVCHQEPERKNLIKDFR